MKNKLLKNREKEIISSIERLVEDLAFMPVGTRNEEKIKTILIMVYKLIKAGQISQVFDLLMENIDGLVQKENKNAGATVN